MPGPLDRQDDAAVWRRWRSATAMGAAPAEPDALLLAAYAEGRLTEEAAETIEDWLAASPAAADDVLAARRGAEVVASEAIIARAAGLVGAGAEVLPFRRPRQSWRVAASWTAMAASLVMATVLGYSVGHDAGIYTTLAGGPSAALGQELIDPPTGLFNGLDEDSST